MAQNNSSVNGAVLPSVELYTVLVIAIPIMIALLVIMIFFVLVNLSTMSNRLKDIRDTLDIAYENQLDAADERDDQERQSKVEKRKIEIKLRNSQPLSKLAYVGIGLVIVLTVALIIELFII